MVVRKDLSSGAQIAQSLHAYREFISEYPEIEKKWHLDSNYIVILHIENEEQLKSLINQAKIKNIKYSVFRELDMELAITAAVFEPTAETQAFLKHLPRAFKEEKFDDKYKAFKKVIRDMEECPQFEGQTVLQHGFSVKDYTFDLINHLRNQTKLKYQWKIPDWIYQYKEKILSSLPDDETLIKYCVFHDCGKPYALSKDESGVHFKNHAQVSFETWSRISDDTNVGKLILHDMDIHLLKSDGLEEFCQNPNAITHLLVGLAEIHSNSEFFGGQDSDSFKIKYKQISKRGRQICLRLFL